MAWHPSMACMLADRTRAMRHTWCAHGAHMVLTTGQTQVWDMGTPCAALVGGTLFLMTPHASFLQLTGTHAAHMVRTWLVAGDLPRAMAQDVCTMCAPCAHHVCSMRHLGTAAWPVSWDRTRAMRFLGHPKVLRMACPPLRKPHHGGRKPFH